MYLTQLATRTPLRSPLLQTFSPFVVLILSPRLFRLTKRARQRSSEMAQFKGGGSNLPVAPSLDPGQSTLTVFLFSVGSGFFYVLVFNSSPLPLPSFFSFLPFAFSLL